MGHHRGRRRRSKDCRLLVRRVRCVADAVAVCAYVLLHAANAPPAVVVLTGVAVVLRVVVTSMRTCRRRRLHHRRGQRLSPKPTRTCFEAWRLLRGNRCSCCHRRIDRRIAEPVPRPRSHSGHTPWWKTGPSKSDPRMPLLPSRQTFLWKPDSTRLSHPRGNPIRNYHHHWNGTCCLRRCCRCCLLLHHLHHRFRSSHRMAMQQQPKRAKQHQSSDTR